MIENFILLSDIINKIYQVDVKEKNRVRKVQDLKKVFSLIAYEKIKGFRYTETGHFLKLTHATIIHQVKSAKNLLKYDNYFKEIYDRVEHEFLSLRKNTIEGMRIDIEMLDKQKEYLKKQFFYATLQESIEALKDYNYRPLSSLQ